MLGVAAKRIVHAIRKPRNNANEAIATKPGGTGLSGRSAVSRRSPMGVYHWLRVASCISSRKAAVAATRDLFRGSTMFNEALRFLLNTVFGFVVYASLLRFIMQWMRAPFRNPVGQAVTALTDWAVKPLRRLLPGFGGYDWASLLFAWIGQVLWLGARASLGRAGIFGTL